MPPIHYMLAFHILRQVALISVAFTVKRLRYRMSIRYHRLPRNTCFSIYYVCLSAFAIGIYTLNTVHRESAPADGAVKEDNLCNQKVIMCCRLTRAANPARL